MPSSPYFTSTGYLGGNASTNDTNTEYPDLRHPPMYDLADHAMQAHQECSHLAGLVEAANVAAGREKPNPQQENGTNGLPDGSKSQEEANPRKRKRSMGEPEGRNTRKFVPPAEESHSPLFRRTSTTSKKSTRPPMSKLFSSLQLSPENFLQLQSVAKGYMLDESFPDRQDTVGVRGKGDNELVRLRLWNCVNDFLEAQGNGNRFFGAGVPGEDGAQRTMIWPGDKNQIISATTPLLRRIITNERQRQYALETRKGSTNHQKPTARPMTDSSHDRNDMERPALNEEAGNGVQDSIFREVVGCDFEGYQYHGNYTEATASSRLEDIRTNAELPKADFDEIVAIIDYHIWVSHSHNSLTLKECSRACENGLIERMVKTDLGDRGSWGCPFHVNPCEKSGYARGALHRILAVVKDCHGSESAPSRPARNSERQKQKPGPSKEGKSGSLPPGKGASVLLSISLIQDGKRLGPRREETSALCPHLHTVIKKALDHMGPTEIENSTVKALLPDGLRLITEDSTWRSAIETVKSIAWMDNELKVLVEI